MSKTKAKAKKKPGRKKNAREGVEYKIRLRIGGGVKIPPHQKVSVNRIATLLSDLALGQAVAYVDESEIEITLPDWLRFELVEIPGA